MRLLTVGRPRDKRLVGLVEEYLKRFRANWTVSWETVLEEPLRKGPDSRALDREQERLLRRVGSQDIVVLLDVEGEMVDSRALAQRLQQWRESGHPITIIVGGSWGTGEAVRQRAQWRWSLSSLTFSHGLAQVMVAEQLYRAWTISQGHPYHK
ncbi:MAG: 50S rRNA methyltransferase [Sulfobacillus acidophilus]|uniref:Ribosomal RNA large subunit methyltransferase H n=1 Tax=Sulfobacillus acidophilus TaxID=53633 RepID=A0A2T2WLQ5_9FIRM|nr:MAG: 50S rRNA methyltransferase [Sulfobacillus acidophilus]